ncbi:hypothetical protein, partial [Citrobacter sp. VF227]
MLGGADHANGELPSYSTGANNQRWSANLLPLQPVVLPLNRKSTQVGAVIFVPTAESVVVDLQKAPKIRQ